MGRLSGMHTSLAVGLLLVWAATFSISLRAVLVDAGVSPLFTAPGTAPDAYPTLIAFRPYTEASNAELRIGDRLVRVGESDLRGARPIEVFLAVSAAGSHTHRVPLQYERQGERHETQLALGSVRRYATTLPLSFTLVLLAGVLLLRAAPTPAVRFAIPGLMLAAIEFCTFTVGGDLGLGRAVMATRFVAEALTFQLLIYAALLLPDRAELPASPWWRGLPWLNLGRPFLNFSAGVGAFLPAPLGLPAAALAGMASLGALGAALAWSYRRTTPVHQRQLRSALLVVYLGVLPLLLCLLLAVIDSAYYAWAFNAVFVIALVPIGLLFSIARHRWFDVDRLISATASYNLLGFAVLAGALLVVPRAAEAAAGWLGLNAGFGRTALTLVLAAGVLPAHRRLRPAIERRFFPERAAVDAGATALLRELSEAPDPQHLVERLGEGLVKVFRPQSCVVYASGGDGYAPVFQWGVAAPSAIPAESPLVATLRRRDAPLAFEAAHGGDGLDPFGRAVLESLGAAVVLPVGGDELPTWIVSLGGKRSGDVYTTTDLHLLEALSDKSSAELRRFDREKVIEQSREMQQALRRYVPGAVASRIESGADLSSGEREVSVLFVDIRGYTGYAEQRGAEEIFSTINRYTETVSEIVRRHGGSVVEFNGDGMMAVFGAPETLADKERAAVRAGRAIFSAVRELRDPSGDGGEPLTVGVGIATGPAFVGSIRAVDRMIWSAVGNTTNLAARLQVLTRALDAAVVVDAATWQAVRLDEPGFVHHAQIEVRGRSGQTEAYALPLPQPSSRGGSTSAS